MSDLIERQAAIDALSHMCSEDENRITVSRANVNSMLRSLPSTQPERKRGEWLDNETSYSDDIPQTCTCSVCGIRSRRPIGDFCKWCGADMRGTDETNG